MFIVHKKVSEVVKFIVNKLNRVNLSSYKTVYYFRGLRKMERIHVYSMGMEASTLIYYLHSLLIGQFLFNILMEFSLLLISEEEGMLSLIYFSFFFSRSYLQILRFTYSYNNASKQHALIKLLSAKADNEGTRSAQFQCRRAFLSTGQSSTLGTSSASSFSRRDSFVDAIRG